MTTHDSSAAAAPRGALRVARIPFLERPRVTSLADAIRFSSPRLFEPRAVKRWRRENLEQNMGRSFTDQALMDDGRLRAIGHLWLAKVGLDGITDYGLVSCRVVTDAGVNFLVDAMQGLVEPEAMRFHGLGTGSAGEAANQTALGNELTNAYSSASTRPTGTLGEKAGDSKTFESTATITVSAAVAATEHGIFTQAGAPGGVMLDRSVFAVVNLAASESLQTTYQLTFPSGG